MELIWTDLAKATVRDIAQYVEGNFSRSVAETAVRGIYNAAQQLLASPRIGRPALDWQKYGEVRCLGYRQNQIYYTVRGERITIIIVWDGRQSPDMLLNLLLDFFSKASRAKSYVYE